jgi:alpha 1,2-mannosyltransferase
LDLLCSFGLLCDHRSLIAGTGISQGLAVLHFISQSSLPLPSTSEIAAKIHGPILQDSQTPSSQPEPVPHDEAEEPLAPSHDHDEHGPGPLLEQIPAGSERVNATFVTLARNRDIFDIVESIQHVEDRFNRNYHYDWVFLNDDEFDEDFKKLTTAVASGRTFYGKIPKEHWSFPSWIDQKKAAKTRERMKQQNVIYGDSVSYRHMCRYESGFFFRHELMMNYDYYWRVEPSVKYYCDIPYDPFKLLRDSKKKYGFVLSLKEYILTVETLWDSVKKYMKKYPEYIAENNTMEFVSDDGGNSYNLCHFVCPSSFFLSPPF